MFPVLKKYSTKKGDKYSTSSLSSFGNSNQTDTTSRAQSNDDRLSSSSSSMATTKNLSSSAIENNQFTNSCLISICVVCWWQ